MKYAISIDWLALFCKAETGKFEQVSVESADIFHPINYGYKKEDHGTRQYKELWTVSVEGGELCEVQAVPCSGILAADSVIVKFANRLLYTPLLWYFVDAFLRDHHLTICNISRCDICADFLSFAHEYDPVQFITDFLSAKIRRVGRGTSGGAYFQHGAYKETGTGYSISYTNYNGLSFGSHSSAARVYLYNKTLELEQVKNKPYIRDFWRHNGLVEFIQDPKTGKEKQRPVWRLEVSIKSKANKFVNKAKGHKVEITTDILRAETLPDILIENGHYSLTSIYFAFVRQLFKFIKNRQGITNVSRETPIELFEGDAQVVRGTIREKSCSTRSDKILIHSLWNAAQLYRELGDDCNTNNARRFCHAIANSTDLQEWLKEKSPTWEQQLYK